MYLVVDTLSNQHSWYSTCCTSWGYPSILQHSFQPLDLLSIFLQESILRVFIYSWLILNELSSGGIPQSTQSLVVVVVRRRYVGCINNFLPIIIVLVFPPSESWRSLVSFESL